MKAALAEAKKAYMIAEVPVGAVIVYNNKIIARGHNTRETNQSVLGHAEINAIKKASKKIGSWRLEDCDIYVTLEPCPMCSGAIIQSRIKNLYFENGVLYAELLFGNVTLRPDYFVEKLQKLYGGEHITVLKKDVRFLNGLTLEEYLNSVKQ
jgi:deoxycytidylate deaminase